MQTVHLANVTPAERRALTRRQPVSDPAIREATRQIVAAVRDGGDAALHRASQNYGGGLAEPVTKIGAAAIDAATARVGPELLTALQAAAAAVRSVHMAQRPQNQKTSPLPGVEVERRWSPLRRVGVYAPGGLAAYPSSVLMACVPAVLAGVAEVVVASPAGPDGTVNDAVLAACRIGGATEFHAMGGAQAIAALAYGTETIVPVDKIVGPGNAWVTAAKLEVFGVCGIDLPAGPSEALEIADDAANPRAVAADLISQAEHGPDSIAVLVTTSSPAAEAILAEVDQLLAGLGRADVIRRSLRANGLVVVAQNLGDACRFANDFAPEHLGIHTDDPESVVNAVPAAGSVFAGYFAPHSAGDYATGANHVLPTGGLARAYGPLGVEDFGSYRQVQRISEKGLRSLQPTVAALAEAEGLTAHRLAVDIRFEEEV